MFAQWERTLSNIPFKEDPALPAGSRELRMMASVGVEDVPWVTYQPDADGIRFETLRGEVRVAFDPNEVYPYPRQAVLADGVLRLPVGRLGSARPEMVLGSDGSSMALDCSELTGQDESEGHIVAAAVLSHWGVPVFLLSYCLCVCPSGGEPLVVAQFDPKQLELAGRSFMGVKAWALEGTPDTGLLGMAYGFRLAWGDGLGSTFVVVHKDAVTVQHVLNSGTRLGAADDEPRDADVVVLADAEREVREATERLEGLKLEIWDRWAGLAQGEPLPPAFEGELWGARLQHFRALARVDTATRAQARADLKKDGSA